MIPDVLGGHWSRREKQQWLTALLCGCVGLFACRQTMPLCLPEIARHLNWSKTDMGWVLSAFFWGFILTQILGGYLSDRFGGPAVLTAAAIGWVSMTLWMPVIVRTFGSHSWGIPIIICFRMVLGAFQGFHYPAIMSLLSLKAPTCERAFCVSFVTSGAPFGTLIAGGVGSFVLEHFGWQYPFYCMGLASLLWLLYVRFYLSRSTKKRRYGNTLHHKAALPSNSAEHTPVPWRTFVTKGPFWAVVIGQFCSDNAWFILLCWSPTYFKENFPDGRGWVCNVLPWMVSVPCRWMAGLSADYLMSLDYSTTFVRKLMQSICFLGSGSFLIILSAVSSYEASLICVTLVLAFNAFHNAGVLVNAQDIAPKYAGSVFGVMSTAGALPGIIGVYVVGHILQHTHSWATVFVNTGLLCYAGLAVFLVFGSGKPIVVKE